ncbi:MAG: hypothetical protein ACTSRO_08175, partial [Candidatus Heimdallarchaeaceae archaeon]
MAYNTLTKKLVVLLMISCITLEPSIIVGRSNALLSLLNNSSHTTQPKEGVILGEFTENLTFSFSDTSSESTLSYLFFNASLSNFNIFNLSFIVEGDPSTKAGISVSFSYNSLMIDFLIERNVQDGIVHSLSQSFFSTQVLQGDINFTVHFQGQAAFGQSGVLTILAQSLIQSLPIIEINEETESLLVSPATFSFEGNIFGSKEYKILTVFNNTILDSKYALNLSLSFFCSEFQFFNKELKILVNDSSTETLDFETNSQNELNLLIQIDPGLIILSFVFRVDISSDLITISNLKAKAKMEVRPIYEGLYKEISWEDEINTNINLENFKPFSEQKEIILNITLTMSFEGTVLYDGIRFSFVQGEETLYSNVIPSSLQTEEKQNIFVSCYTTSYQESLILHLSGTSSGSGTIFLYNSSFISISTIEHIEANNYVKMIAQEVTIKTPTFGFATKNFFDVIFIEDDSKLYSFNFSMVVETADTSFNSISVSLKINNILSFSENFYTTGEIALSKEVSFSEGYNELSLVLTISGQGSTITLKNLLYSIQSSSSNPSEIN